MSRDEIIAAINDFVEFISERKDDVEVDETSLALALDRLALAYHFSRSAATNVMTSDPPQRDYNETRKIIAARFPNCGYYNLPSEIGQNIAETGIMVGDAIDDITDIALDMQQVKWRLDNTDIDDALWHFSFTYEAHWGDHLRRLQLYLHDRNFNRTK